MSRPFCWRMPWPGFPASQREALVLHYWQGFSLAEIAARLDRTPDAVAGLLKRGLKHLRARARLIKLMNRSSEGASDVLASRANPEQ